MPASLVPATQVIHQSLPKNPPPNPHLHRIDPRIRRGHPRIRNMQEPHFRAPIMLLPQDVHPQCPARREINLRSSFRHLFIREQRSPLDLEKRLHLLRLRQYPFERKRIDAPAIHRIRLLHNHPCRHHIKCIFQLSLQKSRSMRASQNQSVPQSEIPHARIRRASINPVPPASPDLQLPAGILRRSLRPCLACPQQSQPNSQQPHSKYFSAHTPSLSLAKPAQYPKNRRNDNQ